MKIMLISAFCLAPMAFSQVTSGQGGTYKFATKYAKGQTYKYNMSVKAGGPTAVNQAMSVVVKVLDVKPNGNKTLQTTTIVPGQKPQSTTLTLDKFGKPVDNNFGTFAGSLGLPLNPVKVGEKWSGDVQMAGGMAGGVPIKGRYVFKGISTVRGTKVATIHFDMDMKALFNSTGSGDQLIRVSDGQLFGTSMVMNMDVPDPKTKKLTKIKMSIAVNLVQ